MFRMPAFGCALLRTLILAVVASQAIAADSPPAGADKVSTAAGYPGLAAQLASTGKARVIVTLAVLYRPEGYLPDEPARMSQGYEIAAVQGSVLEALAGTGVENVRRFHSVPQMAMSVDAAALQRLLDSPDVLQVAEDELRSVHLNLSVPRVQAPSVWSATGNGSGVAVAVLDTGVDKNHGFLSGAVVSEACYSGAGYPGGTSCGSGCTLYPVCPGGVNTSTASGSAMPYAGACVGGDCDHGTHVAGIVAGRNNGSFSGVAPGAGIIAIQVFTQFYSTTSCAPYSTCARAYTSDIMLGLQRVVDLRTTYNIAAVNMSLGGGRYYSNCDSDSTKPLIDTLRSYNIATVISSGNSAYKDSMGAPGCVSSAISVGATTDSDTVASYSNSASFLHLLAPGSSINSSVPGNFYSSYNGTSMAAPHVAGAFALLRQSSPSSTVTQTVNALITTGLGITDTNSLAKPRIRINDARLLLAPPITPTHAKAVVFRNGFFFLDVNGNGAWEHPGADRYQAFGVAGDVPVMGDWNGDGKPKMGVFRNGFWFLDYNGNGAWDGAVIDRYFAFGMAGDIPVVGDWNHNGRSKVGVYRNGFWFLDHNGNNMWDSTPADLYYAFGSPGDRPVTGDWSGNGYWKIGVFRDGFWFLDYNGNGKWDGSFYDIFYAFGTSGDMPVAGDWSNNSLSKIGIFRNGFWFLDYNGSGTWQSTPTDRYFPFGAMGDVPLVGKGTF